MTRALVAALLVAFVLMLVAACGAIKVEGGCTYVREVKATYHCPADGKVEHYRLAPGSPEP